MLKRCRLPIYDIDGKDTGGIMKVEPPTTRIIDEGVAQITLIYRIIRGYPKKVVPGAKEIKVNTYDKGGKS